MILPTERVSIFVRSFWASTQDQLSTSIEAGNHLRKRSTAKKNARKSAAKPRFGQKGAYGWVGGCGLTELWAQGYSGKKALERTFPRVGKIGEDLNLGSNVFLSYHVWHLVSFANSLSC